MIGHAIIFYQSIIHEVLSTRVDHLVLRLFFGWRLTDDANESIIPELERRMRDGDVIPLKSGQIPPMYPNMYKVNWMDKVEQLSKLYKDGLMKTNMESMRKDPNNPGKKRRVVYENILKQTCPSLKELGLTFKPEPEKNLFMYYSHKISK